MKIKAILIALALGFVSASAVAADNPKAPFDPDSCCAKAHAAGKVCDHNACCTEAFKANKVCAKCNPKAGAKEIFTADSCCAKAVAQGKGCTHPCCLEAAKAGEVCAKCNKDKKKEAQ